MASDEGCTATEPITVDGATGLIGAESCERAVVTTAGRGYWISLRTSDNDPAVVALYDRAWFEEVLATVQLHPEAPSVRRRPRRRSRSSSSRLLDRSRRQIDARAARAARSRSQPRRVCA